MRARPLVALASRVLALRPTARTGPARATCARTSSRWRRTSIRRWSRPSTGATRRPPSASCSSSAGGTSWAAAATLIASYGAAAGMAARSVPDEQMHVSHAGGREAARRPLAELRLALDAPHLGARAERARQRDSRSRCRRPALVRLPQLQQLAHARDHDRLRDRLPGADRQSSVLPCEAIRRRGRTGPRDGRDRRQHPLVPYVRAQLLD